MGACERCGASPDGEYGLHDYCAECSRNLCDACAAKGCCGHVPALSGMDDDYEED
jgi:hypothetical protein